MFDCGHLVINKESKKGADCIKKNTTKVEMEQLSFFKNEIEYDNSSDMVYQLFSDIFVQRNKKILAKLQFVKPKKFGTDSEKHNIMNYIRKN